MQKETRFSELIRLQQDSGFTVREFCSNEGIAPSTFYYWKKKLRGHSPKKEFIPLVVKPSLPAQGNRNTPGRRSHPVGHTIEDHVLLELVYPNGTLLRIKDELDLADLKALIHLFD